MLTYEGTRFFIAGANTHTGDSGSRAYSAGMDRQGDVDPVRTCGG